MDAVKTFFEPISRHLPEGARDFLDGGGWWLVVAVLALAALALLGLLARLAGRAVFGRRRREPVDWDQNLSIDLADCPLPVRPPGDRRVTVYHQPARLRLVVLAPSGTEQRVDATAVERLLERVVPGLGAVALHDRPRVRVWPPQLSYHGFANTFHRVTHRPEPEEAPSRWVLLAGRAQLGKQPVLLGLGLWTDEPTVIGRRTLEPHEWLGVLRVGKS